MAPSSSTYSSWPGLTNPDVRQLADALSQTNQLRLAQVLSQSSYLARFLNRFGAEIDQPLGNDWLSTFQREHLSDALSPLRTLETPEQILAEAKMIRHRETIKILASDLTGERTLPETTQALTELAEALFNTLLEFQLARAGLPSSDWPIVLAMGKFGAHELNYSSDIDLIFLFTQRDPHGSLKIRLTRVLEETLRLFGAEDDRGQLYRIDLNLRPFGTQAPILIHYDSWLDYLRRSINQWDRYAYIKARPIFSALSEHEATHNLSSDLSPVVWVRYLDFRAIEHIRDIKARINYESHQYTQDTQSLRGWNIKLGIGGIREIEFFVQTLQLIYGGKRPGLRKPASLDALESLHHAGLIDAEVTSLLSQSLIHFRHLEHRLQIREDRQTHTFPISKEHTHEIISDYKHLSEPALLSLRRKVSEHFRSLFKSDAAEEATEQQSGILFDLDTAIDLPAFASGQSVRALRTADKTHPEVNEASFITLKKLSDGHGFENLPTSTRSQLKQLLGLCLPRLLQGPAVDQAISFFDRFCRQVRGKAVTFDMLIHNPAVLNKLVSLFQQSDNLSRQLLGNPDGLDLLALDHIPADRSYRELARGELRSLIDEISQGAATSFEALLDGLRQFARAETLRLGIHYALETTPIEQLQSELTWLADVLISEALLIALQDSRSTAPRLPTSSDLQTFSLSTEQPNQNAHTGDKIELLVLSLGRLGTRQMNAGSDLDLVFVYHDPLDRADVSAITRCVQRMITILSTPTARGRLYEIDPRLRPSGNQGVLVTSLQAFRSYLESRVQGWERIALCKARPIVGSPSLTHAVMTEVVTLLENVRLIDRTAWLSEIASLRQQIFSDQDRKGRTQPRTPSTLDLKECPGGIRDIELVVTGLHLCDNRKGRPLELPLRLPDLLDEAAGLLESDSEKFKEALSIFEKAQAASRILVGKGPNLLDTQTLDVIASRLCYSSGQVCGESLRELTRQMAKRLTDILNREGASA